MLKIASLTLASFSLALLAVVGLDAYTARRAGIDTSGVLSASERYAQVLPDPPPHAKKRNLHRHQVCAIEPSPPSRGGG